MAALVDIPSHDGARTTGMDPVRWHAFIASHRLNKEKPHGPSHRAFVRSRVHPQPRPDAAVRGGAQAVSDCVTGSPQLSYGLHPYTQVGSLSEPSSFPTPDAYTVFTGFPLKTIVNEVSQLNTINVDTPPAPVDPGAGDYLAFAGSTMNKPLHATWQATFTPAPNDADTFSLFWRRAQPIAVSFSTDHYDVPTGTYVPGVSLSSSSRLLSPVISLS